MARDQELWAALEIATGVLHLGWALTYCDLDVRSATLPRDLPAQEGWSSTRVLRSQVMREEVEVCPACLAQLVSVALGGTLLSALPPDQQHRLAEIIYGGEDLP